MFSGNVLVVSDNCSYCIKAKEIINKLIAEGFDIKIEDISLHPGVKAVPTLKIGDQKYIGLLSESKYRRLLK